MPEPTPQQLLDLPLPPNNPSGAATVRGYLIKLLHNLWRDEADFNYYGTGYAIHIDGPVAVDPEEKP